MNYSYGEMQSMQEDAIRRVREMQRQATAATEDIASLQIENPEEEKTKETIKLPNCRKPKSIKSKLSFLNDENSGEDLLLIALIVLLLNEDTDLVLVLALLYILAD